MKSRGFLLLTVLLTLAGSVQAGVILSDDFESYAIGGIGVTVSAPGTFGQWGVTAGSVDLLNNTSLSSPS